MTFYTQFISFCTLIRPKENYLAFLGIILLNQKFLGDFSSDIIIIWKYLFNKTYLDVECKVWADMSCDGRVNAFATSLIKALIVLL